MNSIEDSLNRLAELPIGWDGEDGVPANPKVVKIVKDFFEIINKFTQKDITRPHIVPFSNGNIQLEWHRNRNACLELEFSETEISYLKCEPYDPMCWEEGEQEGRSDMIEGVTKDYEEVAKLLDWIMNVD